MTETWCVISTVRRLGCRIYCEGKETKNEKVLQQSGKGGGEGRGSNELVETQFSLRSNRRIGQLVVGPIAERATHRNGKLVEGKFLEMGVPGEGFLLLSFPVFFFFLFFFYREV